MDAILKKVPITFKILLFVFLMVMTIALLSIYSLRKVHQQISHSFYRQSALSTEQLSKDIAAPLWLEQDDYVSTSIQTFKNTPHFAFVRLNSPTNDRRFGFQDAGYDTLITRVISEGSRSMESDSLLILRSRVSYNGETVGYLIAGFSKADIIENYNARLRQFAVVTGGVILFTLFIAYLFSQSIVRPLKQARRELENNIENASDFSFRLPERGGKELVELSRAFNTLAESAEENWLDLYQQLPSNQNFFYDNPVPMIITDPFWNIRSYNHAVTQLLPREKATLQGRNLENFIKQNDLVALIEKIREKDDNIRNALINVVVNSGNTRQIPVDIILLRNEFRAVTDYLVVLYDNKQLPAIVSAGVSEIAALQESNTEARNALAALQAEFDKQKHRRQRLERLIRTTEKMILLQEKEKIVSTLASESNHLLGGNATRLYLWDESEGRLISVHEGGVNGSPGQKALKNSGGAIWNAAQTRATQYVSNYDAATYAELGLKESDTFSIIVLPLVLEKKFYGVMAIWRSADQPFKPDESQLVSLLIQSAVVALDRSDMQSREAVNTAHLQKTDEQFQTSLHEVFQQQKMESLEILVGGIAHDFNNILGIITPNIDLLRLKHGENPDIMKRVKALQDATKRATDLTRQMVIFTQSDPLSLRPVTLNHLIERVSNMLQRAFGDLVRVELSLSPAVHAIQGDESKLAQALVNLAVNARDAMPGGGKLIFKTAKESYAPPGEGSEPQNYVKITVEDTGSGIPQKHLYNIFDPFFTTKPPRKGSGMGLAVVYGIIKSHGGFITVQSEENKGTRFDIYLKPAAVQTASLPQKPQEKPQKQNHADSPVLIVDDEKMVRQSLKELLKYLGYKVYEAASGQEAIKLMHIQPGIRIAIVDFAMPQMNGIETIRALLAIDPTLRIVLTSGYADQEKAVVRYKGIHGFLHKPVILEKLSALMESIHQPTHET